MKIDFSKKTITQDDEKEVEFKDLVGYTIYDGVGILTPDKTKFIFTESKDADTQTITLGTVKEDGTTELDPSKKPFVIDGQAYFIENGVLMKEPKGPFFATTDGKKGKEETFSSFSDNITVDSDTLYYEQKTDAVDAAKKYSSKIGFDGKDDAPLIKVANSDYSFEIIAKGSLQYLKIQPTPEMEEAFKAKFGDPDASGFYEIKVSDCVVSSTNQIEIELDGSSGRIVANGGQIKFVVEDKEQVIEAKDNGYNFYYSKDAISKLVDKKNEDIKLIDPKAKPLYTSDGHLKFNDMPFDFIRLLAMTGAETTTTNGAKYRKASFGSTEILTCEMDGKPFMMINDNGTSYVYHGSKFYPLTKETEAAKFKEKETGLTKLGLFYTVSSKDISDQLAISFDSADNKQTDLMQVIHDFDLNKSSTLDVTKLNSKRSKTTTYTPIKSNRYKPFGITATTTKPEPEEIKGDEIKVKDNTEETPQPKKDDKKKRSTFWDTMASGCAYTSLMAFIGSALLGMPVFAFIGVLLLGATFMCKGFAAAGGFGFGEFDASEIDTSKLSDLDKTKDKSLIKAYEKSLKLSLRQKRQNARFRKRAKTIEDKREELDKLRKRLTPSLSEKQRKKLLAKIEKIEKSIDSLDNKNAKLIEKASYDQLLGLMGPKPATVDALTVREFDDRIIDALAKKALKDIQLSNEGKDVNYTALPKELRETLGKLTPAERALVIDSLDEASVKIYKDTYSEEIKQKERDIFKEKSDFLKANPEFDFENPALELKLTDFTKVTKKIDGKDVDFYAYEIPDPADPSKKIKKEISQEEMDQIKTALGIKDHEAALDREKGKFNAEVRALSAAYKNVDRLVAYTAPSGRVLYKAVDKDGKDIPMLPIDAKDTYNLAKARAVLERKKKLTPLLQRRKAIEEHCNNCDRADYTKTELEKVKTIKDLEFALKKSKESTTVLKKYKKRTLDSTAITDLQDALKKDGFTEKQIAKIISDPAQVKISDAIEKEEKAYKKNVELKDKLIEENPELQDKLAKLMQGKTPEEQEKIKVAMEEMVRNKKLNSLQKLIAFCDHYTEDKTSDFYAWRTMDETEDVYETVTDPTTKKKTTKLKTQGSVSKSEPQVDSLKQTEDPSKYDYGTAEEEWTSEQLKKKKKKKAKDVTKDAKNL